MMEGMLIYCERTGQDLWAEPLNALTSLAWVVAALAALALCRSRRTAASGRIWDMRLLIGSAALAGVASLWWHTAPGPWSGRLDAVGLHAFLNLYLVMYLGRVVGVGSFGQVLALVVYQAGILATLALYPPLSLNGAVLYLPAVGVMALLSVLARALRKDGAGTLTAAAALFGGAVALHAVDLSLCLSLP